MQSWIVARTRANFERIAETNLKRQNFEVYLPLCMVEGTRGGRLVASARPLFPGYIFIYVVDTWRTILGTYGVSCVIKDGEEPSKLRSSIVEAIRARGDDAGYVALEPRISIGSKVWATKGIMEYYCGVVEAMGPGDRVTVLFRMLGAERPMKFSIGDLALQ